MKMRKFLCALLVVSMLVSTGAALANTVYYDFYLIADDLVDDFEADFLGYKNDGEGAYYVTQTLNDYPDNRTIYYRPVYPGGGGSGMNGQPAIANYISMTSNAKRHASYLIPVSQGNQFLLACRTDTYSGDPYRYGEYAVTGKWTP